MLVSEIAQKLRDIVFNQGDFIADVITITDGEIVFGLVAKESGSEPTVKDEVIKPKKSKVVGKKK